jgi:hypothetical protein
MAIEITPPTGFLKMLDDSQLFTIFLGGSIEMGTAAPWQERVVRSFKDYNQVVLLNPRRDAWDSSWKQSRNNVVFRGQVEWELAGLEAANHIFIYFDPRTKAPISLLELGLFHKKPMTVICPKGFYRKGNVDIVCERYCIQHFTSLKIAIDNVKHKLAAENIR